MSDTVKPAQAEPRPQPAVVIRPRGVETRADGVSRGECLAQLLAGAAEADRPAEQRSEEMSRGRAAFRLVLTACRRCGRPVATGNRALVLPADMKARYDRVCPRCWTPADAEALDAETRRRLRELAGGFAQLVKADAADGEAR